MKIEKINQKFAVIGEKTISKRWLILSLFAIASAFGFYGLRFMNINDSWDSYFLENDPMLLKTEEFKSVFGNDNYAGVLTNCDNTFTKNNLELIRKLSNEMLDSMSYADKITSITNIEFMVPTEDGMVIEQIVPENIPDDSAGLAAIRKKAYLKSDISERLISKDGRLSWILLKLRPFPDDSVWNQGKGAASPETITGRELHKIISKPEYTSLHPKGTGMPYVTSQKMDWIGKEMPRIMAIAALLAVIVLAFATRSVRGVVVPIITAFSSIVIVYGILGYLKFSIDSGMMLIPMLLAFAVAIAYNIHIYSFFRRQFLTHGNRRQAAIETISEMGWPVFFSALTTFAALLSFLAVPVKPLHFVGIATSSCVMLTFLIALTVMPVVLSLGKNRKSNLAVNKKGKHWLDDTLEKFGGLILDHNKGILWFTVILTVFLLYQYTNIQTSFDVEQTMGKKIEYVRNLLEVGDSELGSIYSYDLMIELPREGDAKNPETLRKLDSLTYYVSNYPLTKRTTSVLNILKDINQTLNEGDTSFHVIPKHSDEVAQLFLLYENAGGSEAEYWVDYEYKRLRLMVELKNYNSGEMEFELADVQQYAQRLFPQATVTAVGATPQFTAMMQYVVRGQIVSFAIALLIIGVLMMIVFGSVKVGLIGLIPNITPAIVVGGLMGLLGYPLDMMTATIMPMILGLAVDDTIHFINHGHLEFDRQQNYKGAILRSFRIVGTPLVLTTVVITANFAVYMTSESNSFMHMGILSVAGMVSAILADLCVTPVLFRKMKIFGKEGSKATKEITHQ